MDSDSTTDDGDAHVIYGPEIADPEAAAGGDTAGDRTARKVEPALPETCGWRYMLASLANRDFRFLWATSFLSAAARNLQQELVFAFGITDIVLENF